MNATEEVKKIFEANVDVFKTIERRLDEIEAKQKRPPYGPISGLKSEKKPAFHYEIKTPEDRAFFNTYLRKGQGFLTPEEAKTLTLGSDPQAGYLAPVEYADMIIKGMSDYSPIRREATVRLTGSKQLDVPKRTALPDTYWVSEIEERTEDASLAFGLEKFTPHEVMSFVRVSTQELEDSAFNLEAELANAFTEALAIKEGTAFVEGDVVGKPEGILTNADVDETETAASGTVDEDDLVPVVYKISQNYRPGAKWYMNDSSISTVRLLKDTNGRFIFTDGIAGDPAMLYGYPVVSCPDMPDISGGNYPIVFGNMRKAYMIADRVQLSIQRLSERYAEYGIIGFIARKRVDGMVVLPEAIHKLKVKS